MKRTPSDAYWIQVLTLVPVYVNVFMMGCTMGWTPNAIVFFQQGDEVTASPSEWPLFASCTELGRLILAIPSGILVDKFGRKKITIGAGLLHFKCWILLSITSSVGAILFARFFLGIAIALVNASALIIIGEIASPDIRAELSSIYQLFFYSGIIFQSIISILFSSYIILSVCSLAMSFLFFFSLVWILETPHYLISVSKTIEARKNFEFIRRGYTEEEIDFEFDGMQTYILDEKKEKEQVDWLQFIKFRSIREPLITAVSINFFTLAVGTVLIGSFITVIVPENDIIPTKYYPVILQVSPIIVSIILPFYVEMFPRRTIFLIGAAIVCMSNVFLALTDYCFIEFQNESCRWIFIIGILLQALITSGSVQPMNSTLKSELFPQSVKGFGSSLCVIAQSVANIILYQSYDLVTTHLGQYYVFVMLAVNSLILYLLIYFRLPEARGRYLADLQTRSDETTPILMRYGSIGTNERKHPRLNRES